MGAEHLTVAAVPTAAATTHPLHPRPSMRRTSVTTTTRKTTALLATTLTGALALSACSGGAETGGVPGGPETTEISIAMGPDPVFAPHIIAMENGYFEEAGFESVEPVEFEAGALAGEALAGGEIQLWTPGNLPPISFRHNSLPIVVLGTSSKSYNETLVAREDAGIDSPEDLYDIRIGVLEGSTAPAALSRLAEHYGLDVDRLQTVNLPPPEQLTAIENDEVQAVVVWQPFAHRIAQADGMTVLNDGRKSGFPQDAGENVQISNTRSLWVTSEEFVRDSPNAAQAMVEAMLKAQEFVADPANREEVLAAYVEHTGQPMEEVDAFWEQYEFDPAIDDDYVTDMTAYTQFLQDTGRIADATDPLSYTYTAPLAELDPGAVSVEGQWAP
jgi:ABC-type nitrate/sulfonate/bicarbonate transport system substrate-binding protein